MIIDQANEAAEQGFDQETFLQMTMNLLKNEILKRKQSGKRSVKRTIWLILRVSATLAMNVATTDIAWGVGADNWTITFDRPYLRYFHDHGYGNKNEDIPIVTEHIGDMETVIDFTYLKNIFRLNQMGEMMKIWA